MLSAEESRAPKQQCQALVECKIRHAAWENKGLGLLRCPPVPSGLLLYHSGHTKHSAIQCNCLYQTGNSFATGSLDCIQKPGPFTAWLCPDASELSADAEMQTTHSP